jgi:Ca2+-binding RTX toxin-like protein
MTTNTVTISVENLAPEQGTFLTPLWFGFHDGTFDTYDRGRPVSPGLESLAEDGATELISQEFDLAGFGTVQGTILGGEGTLGPIDPGEIANFTVELDSDDPGSRFFNYASMIIPSNDFFISNGNERAHQIFDEEGNFIGADFIILGSNVLDAGSEVNDEIPANTAFFGQQAPNTGVSENGVVQLAQGFIEGGPILSDPRFINADYTQEGYEIARIRVFLAEPIEVSVFAEPSDPLSELTQEPGAFVFQLSAPAPEGGLVVNFTAGDTDIDPNSRDVNIGGEGTTNIDDFNIRPIPNFISSVTIAEGATEARLVVTAFPDGLVEPDEVISLSLLESDNYSINPDRNFADFTITDGTVDGSGGQQTVVVRSLNTITINNFGGVGQGDSPSEAKLAEVDTIQFEGEGLIAKNLLLTQKDDDLKVSFDVEDNTQVLLTDFKLEYLDNLPNGIGNILFNGDTEIQDSFDVINKNANPNQVFNRNTVTFLNDRNNRVRGFNNSDDVINGQGGNDRLNGLSGDDLLRGGYSQDNLIGGTGDDTLIGDKGNDLLRGGRGDDLLAGGQGDDILIGNGGKDTFYFGADIYADGLEDQDLITDFQARDSFDFSKYLQTGGQISYTSNNQRLLINLSDEDSIIVRGNLEAAQEQLEAII